MGVKKFINSIVEFLDLDDFSVKNKKKTIKNLIEKLKERQKILKKKLSKTKDKKEAKKIKEDLSILHLQLKKANKYLTKLENNNKANKS